MTRLFITNLPFKTSNEDLKGHFAIYGNIKEANIVYNRSGYSRGFGFVEFETIDQADQAMNEANNKPLENRPLRIEKAVDEQTQRGQGGRTPLANKNQNQPFPYQQRNYQNRPFAGNFQRGGGGGNRQFYNRQQNFQPQRNFQSRPFQNQGFQRYNNNRQFQGGGGGQRFNNNQNRPFGGGGFSGQRRFNTYNRNFVGGGGPGRTYQNRGQQRQIDGQRPAFQPKIHDKDEPLSDTVVFVRNLPFSMRNDDLNDLFKDFRIKNAKVVLFGSVNYPMSKGFGFVWLESLEDQKAALEKMNGYKIQEREIHVSKAYKRQEEVLTT